MALSKAKQPIIVSGSGVIWSRAWTEMQQFVEKAGIPFYTTPQGRGVVPDDHPLSFLTMRSTAFKEADLIIVLGTRMNYIIGHAAPPRFNADAKIARIDIDADEIATAPRKVDIGIVGDCKTVLGSCSTAHARARSTRTASRTGARRWPTATAAKRKAPGANKHVEDGADPSAAPVQGGHATSWSATRSWCVDGQEILNYGRQSIPTFAPGHRLNSGPFGTMGVGLPFGARRQGRQARQAGDRAARRRLVRPERHGARHGGAPQAARCWS